MALLFDEMDVKDRYAKAKALHTRLEPTSPPKLQIVCCDFFIRMADKIVLEWKKSGENAFDQLPNRLRNGMFNYIISVSHMKIGNEEQLRKHLYELTFMLMNQTMTKLDYGHNFEVVFKSIHRRNTFWLAMRFQEFQEILAHAAVQCPNLEHLAVQGHKKYTVRPSFTGNEAIDAATPRGGIDHLLQLEQLRHLDIYGLWYWTDEGLNKLFSRLKKLITLKILVDSNATVGGFQKIHLLKELEEFHFVIGYCNNDEPADSNRTTLYPLYKLIYSYCAENVPSLKLIAAPASGYADEINLTRHFHPDLTYITPNIKGISKLEHLHSKSTLPEAEFPNLQHLHFSGPITPPRDDKFFQKFGTFTHLTTLNLGGVWIPDIVAQMLELVGTQLKTLCIHSGKTGDLFEILHLCPNLVRFIHYTGIPFGHHELVHRGDQTSKYEALVTEHNVRLLEHVRANFDGRHGGKDRLFELLLFAPLMKDLNLACISLTKTQCQLFHDVGVGKLRNLEKIEMYDLDLDPSCSMDDVGLVVQCLVCSAPRLHFIEFDWRNEDLTDKWNREQNVAQSFMDLVC